MDLMGSQSLTARRLSRLSTPSAESETPGKKRTGFMSELEHLEHNLETYAFGARRNAIKRTTALKPVSEWSRARKVFLQVTESGFYNLGMVFLIIMNVVHLVMETDLRSKERIIYGDPTKKVEMPPYMNMISRTFLSIYFVDLCLRIYVLRKSFFKSGMNIFDSLVVVADTILTVLPGPLSGLPSMSVLRGLRMLRIVRVIRNLVAFRELYLMMQGLVSAVRAIIFGTALIVAVLILWSILAVELVQEENLRLFNEGAYGDCMRCEYAFSTVGEAMLTFISTIIAGDSWGTLALPLLERVPWTMLIILPALLSLELGLLNVVAAVIVDRQAQARQDDEKFLHQMRDEELKKSYGRLKALFASMDDDGSGSLTLEEMIESYRTHAEFKELMELMDIGEDDLHLVFQILDKDNSGDVTYNEFVEQLNTMRTTNSHTLLVFIKHLANRISEQGVDHGLHLDRISSGLGLGPIKSEVYEDPDLFEEGDHWYEDEPSMEELQAAAALKAEDGCVISETSRATAGSVFKRSDAANFEATSMFRRSDAKEFEAPPKWNCEEPMEFPYEVKHQTSDKQKSAWSVRASPHAGVVNGARASGRTRPSSTGYVTSAAASDLNKRFMALSRRIQTSLAQITEDAVRQAGDNVLWESTMALATLQASLPLLHNGSEPRRLSVRCAQPGSAGASCPRVHPLHLQAHGLDSMNAMDLRLGRTSSSRLSGPAARRSTGGGTLPVTPETHSLSPVPGHDRNSSGVAILTGVTI